MEMMKITMAQNTIKIATAFYALVIVSYFFISFEFFINILLSTSSALFILLASMQSYRRLVNRRIEHYESDIDRDAIEKIEDPYGLYDEEEKNQELNLKTYVKEHKKKHKTAPLKSLKEGAPAMLSLPRLGSYAFLILSFIALKNNALLHVGYFLFGITCGIVLGYFVGRELFKEVR